MAEVILRAYERRDAAGAVKILNDITRTGNAFPGRLNIQLKALTPCFRNKHGPYAPSLDEQVAGFYILHPNNIGRCAHIANASYGVSHAVRGHGIGRRLVLHSLTTARECGFRGLQFNAVVASNTRAVTLYESCGFQQIDKIPGGYHTKSGGYEDIYIYFYNLVNENQNE
ncbi:MAG: N-acetyltransferase family protein [Hydrogeniiclostridium mannosilyticum]